MHSKRDFILGLARVGGLGAAFLGMQALGITPADAGEGVFALPAGERHGTRVVILGGGISGLVAAWELGKAGYDCTILEARERVGGRNWSVRGGDAVRMNDGTSQHCEFDPGLYWNAGPARIPGIHKRMLHYCREMGIRLEVEVNTARAARMYNPKAGGGRPIEMRQAVNDTRGAVSELLAKAIDRGALDQEIAPADRERVFAFLRQYGDLTPDRLYKGSTRAGYKTDPSERAGTARDPLSLETLLDMDLWNGVVFEDIIDQQATMFQAVGGMDHIPKAFEAKLGDVVRRNAEVLQIRRSGKGARIAWRDRTTGKTDWIAADYCISTIPLSVLRDIPADFTPKVRRAIAGVDYHESVKVAWQSRRFWEQDYGIYGGISWVKGATNMVWYPSGELFADQGVLIGAYASNAIGDEMAAMPLARQYDLSRAMVEGLHPGHGKELRKPIALAWKKMPFALGAAPLHRGENVAAVDLSTPDGPFYFAGDYLSLIGNWQEAAVASTHHAITLLDTARKRG